jgi:hypothetical protein
MQQDVPETHDARADGAALAAAAALASVAAAASAASAGQQLRWLHVTLCYSLPARSFHAAVCGACCCVGADVPIAADGACPRVHGQWRCLLCSALIRSRQPHRPHKGGRAHVACTMRHSRAAAAPAALTPRGKRPCNALQPTQRRTRRSAACVAVAAVLSSACCPPTLSHRTYVRAARLCCAVCPRTRPLAPHTPSSPQSLLARWRSSALLLPRASLGLLPCRVQRSAAQWSALLARRQSRASAWLRGAAGHRLQGLLLLTLRVCCHCAHSRLRRASLPSFALSSRAACSSLLSARSAAALPALCLATRAPHCWRFLPLACPLR